MSVLLLSLASLLAVMGLMVVLARSRARVGTVWVHGETMLVDLRDRIAGNGALPPLPAGWAAQVSVRSANGDAFSGDFLVSSLSVDGRRLEVALVDVSGKGREAGTRALLLSGALGGLLGSVPPEDFLSSANAYLLRQRWAEGFATAAHVAVDLTTGAYSVATAGHPAPAQFLAGTATWRLVPSGGGPLLGVMAGASFPRSCGVLGHGDALLVYSDGIIESRGHDLVEGVDRMLGAATDAMIRGGVGLAEAVSRAARSGAGDDRAALALRRH
jgi:serine phosphatase RsbU (regulator of sigma subunit)